MPGYVIGADGDRPAAAAVAEVLGKLATQLDDPDGDEVAAVMRHWLAGASAALVVVAAQRDSPPPSAGRAG